MTTAVAVTALPQRHVEICMGTAFSVDVRLPGVGPAAISDVIRWLHWVDATFSTYRPESEISRLGRGELAEADCHPEVRGVLARCAELTGQTGGYFSASIGGRLDPSGYVKGWAIERASDLLAAAGSVNHCVNGGGDVQCAGDARPGEPWRVGVADPHDARQLIGTVSGTSLAVATSGSSERGAHILDPHTGLPADALSSVTVVGTRLADVDAYATAAFAMGGGALGWLASLPAIRALVVHADGRIRSTPGADIDG